MSYEILYDQKERVADYVSRGTGAGNWTAYTAIGLERSGSLVAGVVYDQYTGPSITMHIAAAPGHRWLIRRYLYACFAYPFLQLGCRRITGPVASDNVDAMKFDLHLGFEYEATLRDAVPSGDLILLVMWKDKCRWIRQGA